MSFVVKPIKCQSIWYFLMAERYRDDLLVETLVDTITYGLCVDVP